ncbi:hypothetical protein Tco_0620061 [Tanacetum coccineum]
MANDPNNVQGLPHMGPNFQNPNPDLRSIEELLHAPTDGVEDAIVDSLNSAAYGNFLTKNTQEALTIIENKSKVQTSRNKTQVSSASGSSAQMPMLSLSLSSVKPPVATLKRTYMLLREPITRVGASPSNTTSNPRADIKATTTWSGVVLDGPSVLPHLSSSSKEVERDPKMIMDQVLTESTIRVPHLVVQSPLAPRSSEIPLSPTSFKIPPHPISFSSELPKRNHHHPPIPYHSRLNKDKLQDKFLISCDYHVIESCMALADLGASINLMPLSVWKKASLPDLTPPRLTLELATWTIDYPTGIAEDVCVQVELNLRDDDEKLIFHADSTSKHPQKHGNESVNMINFIDITCEDRFPEVLNIKKLNHPFSGSTTSPSDSFPSLIPFETSDSLLEEFVDELTLLDPFLSGNEEDNFDPEADLKEIEYFLNRDPSTDSSPKTDIDIIDPILERFTDEPTLLLTSDSTLLEESSESSDIATLCSSPFRNEDKVFNPGILILGGTQIFNDESKDKDFKVNTSYEALLILEECNFLTISSDQELLSHLELSVTETLLLFSSENEDKVFNPGILTSKGVHSVTLDLSHRTYETFKIDSLRS